MRTRRATWLLTMLLVSCGGAVPTDSAASDTPSSSDVDDGVVGSWSTIPSAPIQGRDHFTWVWTDAEVLIWGGLPGPASSDDQRESLGSDGAAYNPTTRQWRVLPPGPLAGRFAHNASWTGLEMLVWGGVSTPDGRITLPDGAAYDPVADTWRSIAPSPGIQPAVAYDPEADRFGELPATPASQRAFGYSLWAGDRIIAWGGGEGESFLRPSDGLEFVFDDAR